jgi:hypothetical protein
MAARHAAVAGSSLFDTSPISPIRERREKWATWS